MCEVYGFCGSVPTKLNKYTDEFWTHARIHRDGFGYLLADKNELYVNPDSAENHLEKLFKKNFTSKLALCHIRFKTHGPATVENCHPFVKTDSHGTKWSLVHNGFIDDSLVVAALGTLQKGETDSERILLAIVEAVNYTYEHTWVNDKDEFLKLMYDRISIALTGLSTLGKTNLIFTDNLTNNMYVYMNSPNTLFYLKTDKGIHISTTKLSNEEWKPVAPYMLQVFNNGELVA